MKPCIYTIIGSGADTFNPQPLADKSAGLPFLCFTTDPKLRSPGWDVRVITNLFPSDAARSLSDVKTRPHRYLADFDVSLYVDNSVLLTESPARIFGRYAGSRFALAARSSRLSLLEEFDEVLRQGLDDERRVLEQFEHYRSALPRVLLERPWWDGVMLRHHNTKAMVDFGEIWSAHVNRYSAREGLSLNHAMLESGVQPSWMGADMLTSWFHSWPVSARGSGDPVRQGPFGEKVPHGFSFQEVHARFRIRRQTEDAIIAHAVATSRDPARRTGTGGFDPGTQGVMRSAALAMKSFVRCRNGRTIFANPADPRGLALVQRGGNLNPGGLHLWRYLLALEEWTDVIDVGANYGEMLVNVDLPETARIVACECNPEILPYLEATLGRLPVDVSLEKRAIAKHSGTVEFLVDGNWSGTSRLSQEGKTASPGMRPTRLEATTLREVLARSDQPIAERKLLLKLDVEGLELDVLLGLGEDLARLAAIGIMLEIVHLSDEHLSALLGMFDLHLMDRRARRLVALRPGSVAELRNRLKDDRYHVMDAVLTRA
ncbi:MAG: hypothetical protein RIS35_2862 [Pseudomonadota bacterium]